MIINGRDLANAGYELFALTGWLTPPALSRAVSAIPGIHGVIPAPLATAEARAMQVGVRIRQTTTALRNNKLVALQDIFAGRLTVRTDDWTDRIVRCVAGQWRPVVPDEQAVITEPTLDVSVPLIAYDGASYDAEPQVITLSSTPKAIPCGTLPSTGIIQWGGAWTTGTARTLSLRNIGGQVVAYLTLTAPATKSLSASEFLEIDLSRKYITHVTSAGVRTNAYSWKSESVDPGRWFAIDPAYGDRSTRPPTLDVSAGTALFLSRKAYEL